MDCVIGIVAIVAIFESIVTVIGIVLIDIDDVVVIVAVFESTVTETGPSSLSSSLSSWSSPAVPKLASSALTILLMMGSPSQASSSSIKRNKKKHSMSHGVISSEQNAKKELCVFVIIYSYSFHYDALSCCC